MTIATRPISALAAGTATARFLQALVLAKGDPSAAAIIADRWRDTPQVAATLRAALTMKATVPGATTADATWAGPLAAYGLGAELVTLVRAASILGALESRLRRAPFATKVPLETEAATAGWVGEGLGTPVSRLTFTSVMQPPFKAQTLIVLSAELLKFGHPSAEAAIRFSVVTALAKFLDQQFLTPTVTALARVRPASVTNGAIAVPSSGTSLAQLSTDLAAMLAAITTDGPLVWIMKPTTAARIMIGLGSAASDLPRTLFGIPLVTSANSPAQVTLLDPGAILFSDDGDVDLAASDQWSLEMDSSPANAIASGSPAAPTPAALVSLWQTNSFGIRAGRYVSWQRVRAGSVVYMLVTY